MAMPSSQRLQVGLRRCWQVLAMRSAVESQQGIKSLLTAKRGPSAARWRVF